MRDAIGNKISDSTLVLWRFPEAIQRGGLIFQVVKVQESSLSIVGADPLPPMITLQVNIPIAAQPGKEAQLQDFLCVVNPAAESAIEKMMEGQRKQ